MLTAVFFQMLPASREQDDGIHVHLMLPPPGVPRGALLYSPDAPRPPVPLRRGEARRQAHVEFEEYVQASAPVEGAMPCWPCPFCLISRFYSGKRPFQQHIRFNHPDTTSEGQRELCITQSDICSLVWCRKGTQSWEACLQ